MLSNADAKEGKCKQGHLKKSWENLVQNNTNANILEDSANDDAFLTLMTKQLWNDRDQNKSGS